MGRRVGRGFRIGRWLALGAGAVLCLIVYQGARAAWWEYRSGAPPRGPVSKPAGDQVVQAAAAVAFSTKHGLNIHGWWIPGKNHAAVILSHGSSANRSALLTEAHLLAGLGYSVLTYDHPGHGESDGKVDWNHDIPEALSAAVDWVSSQPTVTAGRIGALGFSMGATVVAAVAARDPRISAVVLEGCFTDAEDQTRFEYRKWGLIQQLPALWVDRLTGSGPIRPVDHVGAISPRPLLLIAGTDDPVVPAAMASTLYAAAGAPKKLWIVPGAHHGDYASVAPVEYAERLARFFAVALQVSDG